MKQTIYLLLLFIFSACGRGKYYISDAFREGHTDNMRILQLDSTYRFYLREVYKTDRLPGDTLSPAGPRSPIHKRVEVEYLLLSLQHNMAIYFTTIPDKYQQYYATYHFADTLINAYDFSTFYFGTIDPDGESITFTTRDKRKQMIWDIRPFINGTYPERIFLREIAVQHDETMENIILISKALGEPIFFSRQKNFAIIFEISGKEDPSATRPFPATRLRDNRIYIRQTDRGFRIYFRFDNNVHDTRDSTIGFDHRRTRYTGALMEQKLNLLPY